MYLIAFFLLIAFNINSLATEPKGTIEVAVSGIRPSEGAVLAGLFSTENGFPEDARKSIASVSLMISSDKETLYFRDIPYGTYAVAIIHDRNNNGKLDKNFLGMPREGYAVSNNVKGIGPPGFKESSFQLDRTEKIIELSVIYF